MYNLFAVSIVPDVAQGRLSLTVRPCACISWRLPDNNRHNRILQKGNLATRISLAVRTVLVPTKKKEKAQLCLIIQWQNSLNDYCCMFVFSCQVRRLIKEQNGL